MKKLITILVLFGWSVFGQTGTPKTVVMNSGDNPTVFTSDFKVGTNGGVDYYMAWDATYVYFGFTGGNTNDWSDIYMVGIDTDPDGTLGTTSTFYNVNFVSGNQKFDYLVLYENNSGYFGLGANNAYEIYKNISGTWTFNKRTGGFTNDEGFIFYGNPGYVRFRVPWADLSFSRGNTKPIGISMWIDNPNMNNVWNVMPVSNPTGGSPTISKYYYFPSTGDGKKTSTDRSEQTLPVELTSFNAAIRNGLVDLKWETATEINNYGFEVERKISTSEWNKIGFVEGYGMTNSPKFYSFSDKPTGTGKISYRLKQIDNDGKYEYSPIVEVMVDNLPNGFVLEQNYPNPFNPETSIRFALKEDTKATLKVYNSLGAEVATLFDGTAEAGRYYDVKFGSGELASGFYIYKLVAGDHVSVKKMLLMK